ncbi:hypothetical protein MC885_014328, partial [Smutsia gigantea]
AALGNGATVPFAAGKCSGRGLANCQAKGFPEGQRVVGRRGPGWDWLCRGPRRSLEAGRGRPRSRRAAPDPRRQWSNLGYPGATPPDGALVRPAGPWMLAHLPRSGCDARCESRAVLSRERSGEASAVVPPPAAGVPPPQGGARRNAARVPWIPGNPGAQAYWLRKQVYFHIRLQQQFSTLDIPAGFTVLLAPGLEECTVQFSVGHHESPKAFSRKILEDICVH